MWVIPKIIRSKSIIVTAKLVSDRAKVSIELIELKRKQLFLPTGTIYEGTSNIQLNTIAKIIDTEMK